MMEPETVEKAIKTISSKWQLADDIEITLEANPNSVDAEKFKEFKNAGINRLSLGVQALRDESLRFLGRTHSAAEALRAMELTASTFSRFSFDLMYARYGQSREEWQEEVREVMAFEPKHLSLYQLTIEEGTPFFKQAQAGQRLVVEDLTALAMQKTTEEILNDYSVKKYEVSNYAISGEESRHNLVYWNYGDYIGIGPSAHGRFVNNGTRTATQNPRNVREWIQGIKGLSGSAKNFETINRDEARLEALLMGLRLVNGIDLQSWELAFGDSLLKFVSAKNLEKLEKEGFLEVSGNHLKTTPDGMQRLNALLAELIG